MTGTRVGLRVPALSASGPAWPRLAPPRPDSNLAACSPPTRSLVHFRILSTVAASLPIGLGHEKKMPIFNQFILISVAENFSNNRFGM